MPRKGSSLSSEVQKSFPPSKEFSKNAYVSSLAR
jgi:hypothetical protein